MPREGIDRRARSLAVSFVVDDRKERLLPSACKRENNTGGTELPTQTRKLQWKPASHSGPDGRNIQGRQCNGLLRVPRFFYYTTSRSEFDASIPERAFPPPFASLVLIVATLVRLVLPRREKEGNDGIGLGVPDTVRTCTSSVSRDIKCPRLKFLLSSAGY